MIQISVSVPESLYVAAINCARESGPSLDQFLVSALSEKIAAVAASGWFEARAAKGNRSAFEAAMARVADVEPDACDRQ
jgi:hypothetical protein